MSLNSLVWHKGFLSKKDRNVLNKHDSGLIWFTGLSASGKSTIAHALEKELYKMGIRAYVLDGDNVRHGLNSDLGFSIGERNENIRRIVEVSKLFVDAGIVTLDAFISPLRQERQFIRDSLKGHKIMEVYVKCSIEECIRRDPKGQYQKALKGIIKNYTGISSPYEEPESPEVIIDTERLTVDDSVRMLLEYLENNNFLTFKI